MYEELEKLVIDSSALDITVKSIKIKKIEIIDSCNIEHRISMMIRDDRMDFTDNVYWAIERCEGLSDLQTKKLKDFLKSCPGPIMIPGILFRQNNAEFVDERIYDWTRYNVYEAECMIFVEYVTSVQKDRPAVYKMDRGNYANIEAAMDDIHRMNVIGQSNGIERIWTGSRVY